MIAITGGLGFIGSHVADAFLAEGRSVTIVDSEVASVTDGSEYDAHPRCTVVRSSVEEYLADGGSFADAERVVHAAAHVGPAGILQYAGRLGGDIVKGTECVIEACIRDGAPLCVFSSAEVYGRSGRLAEDDDIRVPVAYNARIEYAIAKTLTEAMTVNSLQRGLRGFVIRPFNVAGSKQSRAGGFVMPTFVQQALAGEPITVFGSGEQIRSFTAASDLSRFLTDFWDEAVRSESNVFNIGNPKNRTTVKKLAVRVKELLESESEIVHTDGKEVYGPMYMEAESFEKVPVAGAAFDAGWEPEVDLDGLILQTADYYLETADFRYDRENLASVHASL
jgi:UDP-glucose 4-epimerase